MLTLFHYYFLQFVIAAIIGFATGWWMWARLQRRANIRAFSSAEILPVYADVSASPAPLVDESLKRKRPKVAAKPAKAANSNRPAKASPPRKPRVRLTAIGIPAAKGAADDLLQIKGVGPKLNALANSLGIMRFDQIAAWSAQDIAKVDVHLAKFKGRIVRDEWVHQAKLLASGDIAAFEERYGPLDSENR